MGATAMTHSDSKTFSARPALTPSVQTVFSVGGLKAGKAGKGGGLQCPSTGFATFGQPRGKKCQQIPLYRPHQEKEEAHPINT